MAFIKINPEGMLTVINNLDERASAVDTERTNIDNSSSDNHDPVTSVVTATDPLPAPLAPSQTSGPSLPGQNSCSTNLNACAGNIRALAEELRTRRQEAIDMNSSGITPADANGTVSYYLPDPPAGTVDTEEYWNNTDTAANVKTYNSQSVANAKAESAELAEALSTRDGKSSKGRTYDEILAETAKHQDVPTYAAAYVSSVGVDKYLDMVEGLGSRNTHYSSPKDQVPANMATGGFDREAAAKDVGVLGHIFAAASQDGVTIYDGKGNALDMAAESEAAVEEKGHTGRMSALNGLLETPDTVYGTDFLVDLAGRLEDNSYDASVTSGRAKVDVKYGGAYEGSSMDPLYGVTMAMGNNPDAALTYLTPDGEGTPGEKSADRWKLLTERTWDPEKGLNGFTAALGAASSYRGVTDPNAPVPNADARATWVAGKTIPYFVNNVKEENLTDEMKQNLGLVIGNSPDEFAALANSGTFNGQDNHCGLTGTVADNQFSTLLYRIMDNKNAAGTVAAGIAQRYHNEIESTVPGADNPTDELKEQYQSAARAMGYLDEIANLRANDDKAAQDKAKENASTALSVFSTFLGAGVSAATGGTGLAVAGPLMYNVGSTVAKPLMVDEITKDWNVPDTIDGQDIKDVLRAQSYVDAAHYGLLQDTSIDVAAHNPEAKDNSPFSFYSEVDGKPTINSPDPMTPEAAKSYFTWQDAITNSKHSEPVMTDLEGVVNSGWETGSGTGKSAKIIK